MVKFFPKLMVMLVFSLLFINVAKANNALAELSLTLSSEQLTPGQQLTLTLAVNYQENVDIAFQSEEINSNTLTLLNIEKHAATWQGTHWQQSYLIHLAVPLAGEYPLPALTVIAFDDDKTEQFTTEIVNISVVSVYQAKGLNAPVLADISREVNFVSSSKKPSIWLSLFFFALALLFLIALLIHLKNGRKKSISKPARPNKITNLALSQMMHNLEQTGNFDWAALQQWLLKHCGFDALLAENTEHDQPLLAQFRQLRFQKIDPIKIEAFCQQCQRAQTEKAQHAQTIENSNHRGEY